LQKNHIKLRKCKAPISEMNALSKKENASLQYQCSPNQAKWTKFSPYINWKKKALFNQ